MYGYDGELFETFEQFRDYLLAKYGDMGPANLASVSWWGEDLHGNYLYIDGIQQLGTEGENLANAGLSDSQAVLDAFNKDPVQFSADTYEQLMQLKQAREVTIEGTNFTNTSLQLGAGGTESGGTVLVTNRPVATSNGTVFNNPNIMTAEKDPTDPLKWIGGLRALGGLTLPAWTVAAAPLLGVALGVGLYEANPEFWERVSRELLPFCYDDNGTPKMPISVDKSGNVHTSKNALEKLRQIFIEEGVYDTSGQIESAPTGFDTSNINFPLSVGHTIVDTGIENRGYRIYALTDIKLVYTDGKIRYPAIGFPIGTTPNITSYTCMENTTTGSIFSIASIESSGNYSDGIVQLENGVYSITQLQNPHAAYSYTFDSKTAYMLSSTHPYIEGWSYDGVLTPSQTTASSLDFVERIGWLLRYGDVSSGGVEGTTPESGAVYPTDTSKSLEELYPAWYDNGIDVISNPVADLIEDAVERWVPLSLSRTNNSNNTDDTASTETQTDAQDGTNPDDSQKNQLADAIKSLTEALTRDGILPPDPTTPTDPSGETPTPTPPVITGAGSDLIAIYNPTKGQIQAFNQFLWDLDPTNLTNWKKVIANPIEAVISLHMIYVTPITGESRHIKCGYIETDVSSKIVTNQYVDIDCGTVNISEYFYNVWDYIATTIEIYLPFIGIVPVHVSDVMNSTIKVRYRVDVLTGACLAQIIVYKGNSWGTLYTYAGNCAVPLPLTSGSFTGVFSSLLATAGTAVFGGGAAMAAGALTGSVLKGGIKQNIQRSGSIGSNVGALGIRTPYVIITRKIPLDAYLYETQYGFPANKTVTLGDLHGYTRVKDIHLSGIPCTDDELEQIEALLKDGVIIN